MDIVSIVVIGLYVLSLLVLFAFGLEQWHLAWPHGKTSAALSPTPSPGTEKPEVWPFITVQLPIYNEVYVVKRLLKAVFALDYPPERWEIQVLDDSTDETTAHIQSMLASEAAGALQVYHLHRSHREGYKAGALQAALPQAKGVFIALFDADFVPASDFLKKLIPYFEPPAVGFVQARWGHLNRTRSYLTRLQAFGLDAHFAVEQIGRSLKGYFTNFNGTAGMWRKACILSAGGWSSDTLTEDLDLSYRAQLKGWTYKYVHDVVCPAELPMLMPMLKAQQYRWSKGAAQVAKKHLRAVLKSALPLSSKLHSMAHVLNSHVFICVWLASVLSVPLLYIKDMWDITGIFHWASLFLLGFVGFFFFYGTMVWRTVKHKRLRYLLGHFPFFLAFSMGLSLYNTWAVIEAWTGKKTPFTRTPKAGTSRFAAHRRYVRTLPGITTYLEGFFALYFLFGIGLGLWLGDYGLLFFHALLTLGYGGVFWHTVALSFPWAYKK